MWVTSQDQRHRCRGVTQTDLDQNYLQQQGGHPHREFIVHHTKVGDKW
jgi:hypothetical protein